MSVRFNRPSPRFELAGTYAFALQGFVVAMDVDDGQYGRPLELRLNQAQLDIQLDLDGQNPGRHRPSMRPILIPEPDPPGAQQPGIQTSNENDQSVTAVISFGSFDAVMAGDLSGFNTSRYKNIESSVARNVGRVEVYKVNHHGSDHSSNPFWLRTIRPRIAVISVGEGNDYGHPTPGTMRRLHAARIAKTYWTERGAGARPRRNRDVVANSSIVVQVAPGSRTFTVAYGENQQDNYQTWPN